MITCTLGEKKFAVDYISGRALRELGPASTMYERLVKMADAVTNGKDVADEKITIPEALDVLVKWFCILFNNQFSPDDVYDQYPVDRLIHDIALAIMAVQTQTTEVLDAFPTKAATQEADAILTETPTTA